MMHTFHIAPSRPPRARRRRRLIPKLVLALIAVALAGPAAAQAGTDSFCNGSIPASTECGGPSHSLTGVAGTNYTANQGCGGAIGYGSYICGTPTGCHSYSGSTVLVPGITHNSSTAKTMGGYSTWGSTGSACGSGFAPALGGGSVLPDYAGLPVFERAPTAAPKAVSVMFAGAAPDSARRLTTPKGEGWVFSDRNSREICLAVDDNGTGYGVVCTPWAAADREGLTLTMVDASTKAPSPVLLVALTPAGVQALSVTQKDGTERRVPVDAGVVVAQLAAGETAATDW